MAWTSPSTQSPNALITNTLWNSDLVDNMAYLASRPIAEKVHLGSSYSYSGSAWQDVNATTLGMTITPSASGRLLIMGCSYASAPSGGYLTFAVDGSNVGDATIGIAVVATQQQYSFFVYVTGLTLASHTVKMQYKPVAGTITVYAPTRMWAIEV